MNYRYRQVKLMWERDIAKKTQAWQALEQTYKQDILNLQNSTDAKVIEQLEKDLQKKQTLLNDTVNLLGAEDIKSLSDIENLLKGLTLKELITNHQEELKTKIANRNTEINKISQQLDQTKEKLTFYSENLKTKEGIITEYQQELKQKNNNLNTLQNQQEQLEKAKEQREAELSQQLSLTGQKITSLETNLLTLAKQKLTNQKQAKALVEEIEKEWREKQTQWEQTSQQQQDYAAQELARTKQEHQEQIKQKDQNLTLKQTKIKELQEWSTGQHNRIVELETGISVLELKLETQARESEQKEQEWTTERQSLLSGFEEQKQELAQAKNQELQEQKTFYENQIQAKDNQLQTNEQTIAQLQQQITNHQANINQLTTQNQRSTETIRTNAQRITQLEENLQQSQQDSQNKQTTINQLNQDKVNLQTRITELTQTQTTNTQLQTQLAEQRRALEQLLANRTYNLQDFKAWLEEDPSRKNHAESHQQPWTENNFAYLNYGDNWVKVLANNLPGYARYRLETIQEWKKALNEERKESFQQELTLLRNLLNNHDMTEGNDNEYEQ